MLARNNKTTAPAFPFQTPGAPVGRARLDRKDHIWFPCGGLPGDGGGWKCCLCGALVEVGEPPPCPTPEGWLPKDGYERLADRERAMEPSP